MTPIIRKLPVKRAFTGMAGSPLARVLVTEPEPTVDTPKKRGRPPKHGVAMTDAERTRNKRARQQERQEDRERRNLVAKLMRIYNRQQLRVIRLKKDYFRGYETRLEISRTQKRQYFNEISQLSVSELTETLAVYQGKGKGDRGIKDTTGRNSSESSGGKLSKIELMLGKQSIADVNMGAVALGVDTSIQVLESLNSGAKPTGSSPTQFETEDDSPSAGTARPREVTADETLLQMAINSFIGQMRRGPDGRAKCPCCDETFTVEQGAENHLYERYRNEEKSVEKAAVIAEAIEELGGVLPPGVTLPPAPSTGRVHYNRLEFEIKIVRSRVRDFARRSKIKNFETAVDCYASNFVTLPEFRDNVSYFTETKEVTTDS